MRPDLLSGNARFAANLYRELAGRSAGNVFFSPFGLSSVLALLGAGAAGATQDEMSAVLGLPLRDAGLHREFGLLARALDEAAGDRVRWGAANALWPQKGVDLLPDFLRLAGDLYGAPVTPLDFADPVASAAAINRWVAARTEERIQDLVGRRDVEPPTRLVLTNAVYFKGDWAEPFDASLTEDSPFRLADGSTAPAPLMTQTGCFPYHEDDALQAVALPYDGRGFSLLVILPRAPDGLPSLERSLDDDRLASLSARLQPGDVQLFLPRFTVTSEFRADAALRTLGMPAAFTSEADFSGVTGGRDLFVSAVLHKSFVVVNEAGTEAAAATAVIATLGESPGTPRVFRADRPFLFLVQERRTGSILFFGRFANPRGCATNAPVQGRPGRAAPSDEGPCRFCGKPGFRKGDPRDPWTPLLYECDACDSGRPRSSSFS